MIRQCGDHIENLIALAFWHAGGGLIQQKNFRLGGQRNGYFKQALQTVGHGAHALVHAIAKVETLQQSRGFIHKVATRTQPREP